MRRAATLVGGILVLAGPAGAATLHPGFQQEVVFSGLTAPTSIRFAPDGRIFVAEKRGTIKVYDSLTDPSPTQLVDLGAQVHDFWDRGLLGLAVDPLFPAQPWVYVLYTYNWDSTAPGLGVPRWPDSCPSPPGPTDDGCVVDGRLSRIQVAPNGTMVGSEQVLIEKRWCQQFPSHSIGGLAFDPLERLLYVSAGDGASFGGVDYGQEGGDPGSPTPRNPCGDPPAAVGGAQSPPGAEGGALRSQDLRTAADPVTLDGAVLRIDPDTGAAAPGNPLIGGAAGDDPIIAYGLRNPFRIAPRPGTHEVWIGDVGWTTWEEVNRITDATDGVVENFGWPCYEGLPRQSGYDGTNLNICENLYAAGAGAVRAPFYAYHHDQDVDADIVPFRCSQTGTSSISGMAFESGSSYPLEWNNALFFADYSRNCIFVMTTDGAGVPLVGTRTTFVEAASGPVDLTFGPDGQLYYADLNDGRIMRVSYFVANEPPVASIAADATNGALPLTVHFDASDSADPDPQDPLFYAWDLDGDGEYDDSTVVDPIQTYTLQGVVTVGLRVSDDQGAAGTATLTVTAGNRPPAVSVLEPPPTLLWTVGESLLLSGAATDPEEGNLPAAALDWTIILHHCTPDLSSCHPHTQATFPGVDELEWVTPDHGWRVFLEIVLTATDGGFPGGGGGALSAETRVTLQPDAVTLAFDSDPAGLVLDVGGVTAVTPFTLGAVIGSVTSLTAPSPQDAFGEAWVFDSWSDGGAAAHAITAPAGGLSLTASFDFAGPASDWWNLDWRRRVRLTFDNSGQSTDLVDLPVLVRLDGTLVNYADTRDAGQDVRFVDADGVTVLPHEIERWDEAGTSILWVRVPRVDAGSTTDSIWMYYGHPTAPDTQSPASVWSPDYLGVWHLGSSLTDSTAHGHHGTNNGSSVVPGAVGDGRYFDGAAWVAVAHTSALAVTGALTIEAWAKIDDPDLFNAMRVIDKKLIWDDANGYNLEIQPANNAVTNVTSGGNYGRATGVNLDTNWHMVGATVQGTTSRVWVDGVDFTTDATCDALVAGTQELNIGRRSGVGNYFLGALDEVRLARVARSPDWTRAQYLSLSGAFASFAPAEDNCGPFDATCDGWDDDCDAAVDEDIPNPGLVGGLLVAPGSLSWTSVPGAEGYSVVRGGIGELRATTGDWGAATEACLAPATSATTLALPAGNPPSGDAWWYLTRARVCTQDGSWDDGGPAQAAPRDPGLNGAPLGCP